MTDRGKTAVSPGVPVALTIAGSDSGGGAGVQADLKTFEAFGVWGTCALTAVTAQNTVGVQAALVLPPSLVRAQIDSVVSDIGVSAVKTGMLGNADVIEEVAKAAVRHSLGALVVDPVLVTSHGEVLLEEKAMSVLRDELFPLCSLVTPNLAEAAALCGHPVEGLTGMEAAAEEILRMGARAVLVKGGHLGGPRSPDLLVFEGGQEILDGERVPGRSTHGTGCALSAAICAGLALGRPLLEACVAAKELVSRAITAGVDIGSGVGPVNPGGARRDR